MGLEGEGSSNLNGWWGGGGGKGGDGRLSGGLAAGEEERHLEVWLINTGGSGPAVQKPWGGTHVRMSLEPVRERTQGSEVRTVPSVQATWALMCHCGPAVFTPSDLGRQGQPEAGHLTKKPSGCCTHVSLQASNCRDTDASLEINTIRAARPINTVAANRIIFIIKFLVLKIPQYTSDK